MEDVELSNNSPTLRQGGRVFPLGSWLFCATCSEYCVCRLKTKRAGHLSVNPPALSKGEESINPITSFVKNLFGFLYIECVNFKDSIILAHIGQLSDYRQRSV
jgi:hypothetical protein